MKSDEIIALTARQLVAFVFCATYIAGVMSWCRCNPIAQAPRFIAQRTTWTIGSDKVPAYAAGPANLTEDVVPVLVQNGTDEPHQNVGLAQERVWAG